MFIIYSSVFTYLLNVMFSIVSLLALFSSHSIYSSSVALCTHLISSVLDTTDPPVDFYSMEISTPLYPMPLALHFHFIIFRLQILFFIIFSISGKGNMLTLLSKAAM